MFKANARILLNTTILRNICLLIIMGVVLFYSIQIGAQSPDVILSRVPATGWNFLDQMIDVEFYPVPAETAAALICPRGTAYIVVYANNTCPNATTWNEAIITARIGAPQASDTSTTYDFLTGRPIIQTIKFTNCSPVPAPPAVTIESFQNCSPAPPPPPQPTAGLCNGAPDYGTYPSGCALGFAVIGGVCDRSNQFKSRCDGQGYDPETCTCPDGMSNSPILIDVDSSGFSLTDADGGVDFDIQALGSKQRVAWTAIGSTNAWLSLDRNGNGVIDDSTELFGNFTPQPQSPNPNGFIALTMFDRVENGGNGDGVINKRDAVFPSLRLWQDMNHNGISESYELHTLPEFGIAKLELDYRESKRVDRYGNQFRYRAKVKDKQDAQVGRWAWDVFLIAEQ